MFYVVILLLDLFNQIIKHQFMHCLLIHIVMGNHIWTTWSFNFKQYYRMLLLSCCINVNSKICSPVSIN